MGHLREVVVEAFKLLRRRPVLFIPKLFMVSVWSVLFIYIAELVFNPYSVTMDMLITVLGVLLLLSPFQIWMNNFYFLLVKQKHEDGKLRFYEAVIEAFLRIPRGIAALFLSIVIGLLPAIPGAGIVLLGLVNNNWALAALGVIITVAILIVMTIIFYFTPVAVVVGEKHFFSDFKEGLYASSENRFEASIIVLISFVMLLFANAFEGALGALGIAGFFIGRILAGVIGVYILLMNPEFFLTVED